MLKTISDKALSGQRLTREDAIELFHSDDLFTIGRLAAHVAEKKNGKKAFFVVNRHINPTNICVNRCKFCAFSRSKGEDGAFELTIEEIINKLKDETENRRIGEMERQGNSNTTSPIHPITDSPNHRFREVHIVGGLHPDWSFERYCAMLLEIKKTFPSIAIKAFTAVEIDYFSRISGLAVREVLERLKKSGLQAMPGGGAEIFAERVRTKLCPEKISGERWLEIHRTAHLCGIPTNATMLYGHLESYEDRVDHLMRLRGLQDLTGGFQAFIPLAYHPRNTDIGGFYTSGIDDLKTIAISRLFLGNIPHIKAYWIMLGEKIAQVSLLFGADDLDGTIVEEKITHSAGAMTSEGLTRKELVTLIKKAGKVPVERDAFYNAVRLRARKRNCHCE
ncbi:MAG: CofH family radical SAM protein [Nitrospirae bacterium]|nr:CofH family radical SAM protein [Nitrospirota bacterium]MCL5421930.1 CofH family radical SAM protein [Nitrospirota bacterium]